MKTARRIILVLAAMLCMQMSAAYASINYLQDADLASKDVNNIMTMYLGMPEKDFLYNFSDVQEWKLSEKAESPRGKNIYVYHLEKGSVKGNILETISVEFKNNTLEYIQWTFYTSNEQIKKLVCAKMNDNLEKHANVSFGGHFRSGGYDSYDWDFDDKYVKIRAMKEVENDFPWKNLYTVDLLMERRYVWGN